MLKQLRSLFSRNDDSSVPAASPQQETQPSATEPAKPFPVDVVDADFGAKVLQEARPVVVDFWADWCQPCTIMSVHMGFLLDEMGDQIVVAAMDVEENAETPAKYGIQGLPTVIFFKDGLEVDRQVGLIDYDKLRQRVQALL